MLHPTLLPQNNFVLLHSSFKNNLAKLLGKHNGQQANANLQEMMREFCIFSAKINSVDKTLKGIKNFIKNERLETSKFFPKPYFDNGFDQADNLFFYFRKQDPQGHWIGAIYLFFPHLFLEKNLNNELRCCSFRNNFTEKVDVRFCEVFNITYYEPSLL